MFQILFFNVKVGFHLEKWYTHLASFRKKLIINGLCFQDPELVFSASYFTFYCCNKHTNQSQGPLQWPEKALDPQ